jgi:tetratricopeptide (TPR) repeat protein
VSRAALHSASETGPIPVASQSANSDDTHLIEAFRLAWHGGERLAVEKFLEREASAAADAELVIALICEEICLRRDFGERVESGELLSRFPQWRAELELLLACDEVLSDQAAPSFPEAGDELGEFCLLSELGRGATGRVFLATQPSLDDRPVVVKFTSSAAAEHLSLARLQHTGIVPLYLAQDFPAQRLRALCMPYLGGASLAAVLADLKGLPPERRSGPSIVQALERIKAKAPISLPTTAAGGQFLERESYVDAVCWIGFCIAEALHYAHQRGLVHLDLKPSNVLLAADQQPMLLDFHLARAPLPAGASPDEWLGGTPGYMSPEQAAAVDAIRRQRPTAAAVDARSDIYSLGVLLYEMLGGPVAAHDGAAARPPLSQFNGQVTRGVQDLLARCLRNDANERYADATAVADDLLRHLRDLPLRGVANRSLAERWRKWRRREPNALPRLAAGTVLAAVLAGGGLTWVSRQMHQAEQALLDGDDLLRQHVFPAAIDRLRSGLDGLAYVPGHAELKRALATRIVVAQRRRRADDLHRLVEQLRFLDVAEQLPPQLADQIDDGCREIWAARESIIREAAGMASGAASDGTSAGPTRTDLMDLAILWSGLRVRRADNDDVAGRRREAVQVLTEAENALGRNPVLDEERRAYLADGGDDATSASPSASIDLAPLGVWEHDSLGRRRLSEGEVYAAAAQFEQAVDMAPNAFWPNFHLGVCRRRQGLQEEALRSFSVCVALEPSSARCFYNRGLAFAALGEFEAALGDFGHALTCDPQFAAAALHRAAIYTQQRRFELAAAELKQADVLGGDPGETHYQWALWHLAQNDRPAAIASLQACLAHAPENPDALALFQRLQSAAQEER